MKRAGLKNDGAWYRANKWLKRLRSEDPSFVDRAQTDGEIVSIATEVLGVMNLLVGGDPSAFAGVMSADNLPSTPAQLATAWFQHGIPRQVWLGKLSIDRYTKVGPGENIPGTERSNSHDTPIYVPTNAQAMADAGKRLRKKIADFMVFQRQLQDLSNTTTSHHLNPGGIANATKD